MEAVVQGSSASVSLKRHLDLLPRYEGLDLAERETRHRLRQLALAAHFPAFRTPPKGSSVDLDCRSVAQETARQILRMFAALTEPDTLAVRHFDTAHMCEVALAEFSAAISRCRRLELTDCVLAGTQSMEAGLRERGMQFSSLVLHNVVGTHGSVHILPPLLQHDGLKSVSCTGQASRGVELARMVLKNIQSARQLEAVNIQWGVAPDSANSGPKSAAAADKIVLPTLPAILNSWPQLRSLCIAPWPSVWADWTARLTNREGPTQLTELRLLPKQPLPEPDSAQDSSTAPLVKAIAERFLCRGQLHKLDLRAVPMVGKGAIAALARGLAGAANPEELYQGRPPLVHLSLHLGVRDLTQANPGDVPSLINAIARLTSLTHLHLRLGGPPYHKDSRSKNAHGFLPPTEPPPNQEVSLALQHAIADLRQLRVFILQLAVVDAEYGFRGWRSLPTSCGDLGDSYEQGIAAQDAGGVCVLGGRFLQPNEFMLAALPMGGRVSELQVWDCWESLNGLSTIAECFSAIQSLTIGHGDGVRKGTMRPRELFHNSWFLAPDRFSPLKDLPNLRHLAVVSCKCRVRTLQSVSALTGLELLLLSALELPAEPRGGSELVAVLTCLHNLTKLAIRHCTLEPATGPPTRDDSTWGDALPALHCLPRALLEEAHASVLGAARELPLQKLEAIDLLVRASVHKRGRHRPAAGP